MSTTKTAITTTPATVSAKQNLLHSAVFMINYQVGSSKYIIMYVKFWQQLQVIEMSQNMLILTCL